MAFAGGVALNNTRPTVQSIVAVHFTRACEIWWGPQKERRTRRFVMMAHTAGFLVCRECASTQLDDKKWKTCEAVRESKKYIGHGGKPDTSSAHAQFFQKISEARCTIPFVITRSRSIHSSRSCILPKFHNHPCSLYRTVISLFGSETVVSKRSLVTERPYSDNVLPLRNRTRRLRRSSLSPEFLFSLRKRWPLYWDLASSAAARRLAAVEPLWEKKREKTG